MVIPATTRIFPIVGVMIAVWFGLCMKKSSVYEQVVTSQAWRRLSLDAFTADLMTSLLCCSDLIALNDLHIDDLVKLNRTIMMQLLNQHCR